MSRTLSPLGYLSSQSRETQEAWLVLLRISGTSVGGTETYHLTNNTHEIVSGISGSQQTYLPYGFTLVLAEFDGEITPTVKLTIDNTSQLLTDMIRGVSGYPIIDLWVILGSQPNIAEVQVVSMELRAVSWTDESITGTLMADNFLTYRFPGKGGIYDAKQFPGLF